MGIQKSYNEKQARVLSQIYNKKDCETEPGQEAGPETKKAILHLGYLRPM